MSAQPYPTSRVQLYFYSSHFATNGMLWGYLYHSGSDQSESRVSQTFFCEGTFQIILLLIPPSHCLRKKKNDDTQTVGSPCRLCQNCQLPNKNTRNISLNIRKFSPYLTFVSLYLFHSLSCKECLSISVGIHCSNAV